MTRSHPSLRSLYNDRTAFEYWSGHGERIALHLKITRGGFYSFNASQLHDLGCRGQGRQPIATAPSIRAMLHGYSQVARCSDRASARPLGRARDQLQQFQRYLARPARGELTQH
jgi:hypothetical protein